MSRREVRWIVREGDGGTVGAIVDRAGGDPRAVAEGRVFLGPRRVRAANEPVRVGDAVRVSFADATETSGVDDGVVVLAEEDDLVAVAKPAGMPTIADLGGAAHALVARVALRLGVDASRLHPTSRLDRDVSGVVVIALAAAARERLAAARERGEYARRYVAIATRAPSPDRGTWDAPIGRAKDPRHRAAFGREAIPARSDYRVTAQAAGRAVLALAPVTGRTHQLRVHAGHAGAPLLGDRIYGGAGAARVGLASGRVITLGRVALHALEVTVPRSRGAPLVVRAPVPDELTRLWADLGGDPAALGDAWQDARDVE